MNGIMDENQLTFVKNYEFFKPLLHKIDAIIDNCYRDCLIKNTVTHLNRNVNMISNLQILEIMKLLI